MEYIFELSECDVDAINNKNKSKKFKTKLELQKILNNKGFDNSGVALIKIDRLLPGDKSVSVIGKMKSGIINKGDSVRINGTFGTVGKIRMWGENTGGEECDTAILWDDVNVDIQGVEKKDFSLGLQAIDIV